MKILATIVGLILGALVLWIIFWNKKEPALRPVTELPTTQYIQAEDWGDLAMQGGPSGVGWVLLPQATEGPLYQSSINPAARGFLPPETCGECHQENYQSFIHTAHARTSAEPTDDAVLGSFLPGKNRLHTADPDFWFEMTKSDDEFFQELHIRQGSQEYSHRRRIDFVLGSGNHGQSYLYWEGDRLYQLHVSYLTELDQWVNSPGIYYDGTADFARPVPGRCLDCHTTWFAEARDFVNRFDRRNSIPGVTCVRCHGPGHDHVAYHREFPAATEGREIVSPSRLSNERLNELCAQCHSGGEPLAPAFSYRPGEPLANYLQVELDADAAGNDDPHSANQLARMMKSRCYIEGPDLTCITCHDPHTQERGRSGKFSQKCLKCHQPASCMEHEEFGAAIEPRCVDCHMPSKRDQQVWVQTRTGEVTALVRDHHIAVWPTASERIRKELSEALDKQHQETPRDQD